MTSTPCNPSAENSSYHLEFRSTVDDAWYTVRVVLETDALVVKFLNFYEWNDERFVAGDFRNAEAIDEFLDRCRPISHQLQDSQCSRVIEGMTVCASFSVGPNDIRFYDAVVEAVHYVEHSFAKEEQECLCTFLLFWQHGPNEGNVTPASIAEICLIQPFSVLDSTLASFAKMAKEKFKVASSKSGSVCDATTALNCKNVKTEREDSHLSTDLKSSLSQHGFQAKDGVRLSGSFLPTKEGKISKCHKGNLQDNDLGGSGIGETGSCIHHFILIENLERDLSPSSIMEFIRKQTSISPQAHVFPSLLSESYTRGAIVMECKKKLRKIYEFLSNPDHIVTSSRGRPWVITEEFLRRGTFRTTLGSLMPISQCKFKNTSMNDELKVEHRGCKEYNTAKSLRDLFMVFVEHQQGLHKRLALEEKMILQSSDKV